MEQRRSRLYLEFSCSNSLMRVVSSALRSLGIGKVRWYCAIRQPLSVSNSTPVPRHVTYLSFHKTSSNHALWPSGERSMWRSPGVYVHPRPSEKYGSAKALNLATVQRS